MKKICLLLFLLPSIFTYAIDYEKKIYLMRDGDKQYFVNISGKRVSPFYGKEYSFEDDGIIYLRSGDNFKYGLVNRFGEVFPCKYYIITRLNYGNIDYTDSRRRFGREFYYVQERKGESGGVYNAETGEWIVPPGEIGDANYIYELCDEHNFWYQKRGSKSWGSIDLINKKEIAPFRNIFDEIVPYQGYIKEKKLIQVCKDDKVGFINLQGEIIIPIIHDDDGWGKFSDDYVVLKNSYDNKWYIYDATGKKRKLKGDFDNVTTSVDGMILVKKNGLYGYCDSKTGENVIPCIYYKAGRFHEGAAWVRKNSSGGWGLISKDGKELTDYKYQLARSFDRMRSFYNVADMEQHNEHNKGLINNKGKIMIPCIYKDVNEFQDEYMEYEDKDGKKGIISINNEVTIPAIYDDLSREYCTAIAAKKGTKWGCIDYHNKTILPFDFDEVRIIQDEPYVYCVRKNEQYYIIDDDGTTIDMDCTSHGGKLALKIDQYLYAKLPSDVDVNIPISSKKNDMFAVIISNEKYSEENIPKVENARNDGRMFKEYCSKALGMPNKNIRYIENGTLNQMRSAVNWVSDIAKAYNGKANILFYYAGHGIPDESNSSSYLLPADGFSSDVRSAYPLHELYAQLGNLPAKQITMFLDACFSGAQRNGQMLSSARGVAIKAKQEKANGNLIVLTAAQGDETAYSYDGKKHGLFTYFLLKKMQETGGNVSLGELYNYIKDNVSQYSIVENGKSQTPSINVSPLLGDAWESFKFK